MALRFLWLSSTVTRTAALAWCSFSSVSYRSGGSGDGASLLAVKKKVASKKYKDT